MNVPRLAHRALPSVISASMLVLCFAGSAEARRLVIDFDASAIPIDGQSFSSDTTHCATADVAPSSCRLNVFGEKNSPLINLGFTIRIGTANYSTFYINEAGILTFGAPLENPGTFQPEANFAALKTRTARPFIAPFYKNFLVPDDDDEVPPNPFTVLSEGGLLYGRGMADPLEPFAAQGLVPAAHVVWLENPSDAVPSGTQLVIYYTGSKTDADTTNDGDFAFRIRYGLNDGDTYNDGNPAHPGGIAGFRLGSAASDSRELAAPLAADNDYYFSFHNGHLSTTTSNAFTLTPASIAYGNVAIETTVNRTATLKNTGTAPLPLNDISTQGTNLNQFPFTEPCPTYLSAGVSCVVTVGFRPKTAGAKSARLKVVAGTGAGTPKNTNLTGSGVQAVYTVSPTTLAFGSVPRNTTSAAKTVTVRNTGTVALPVTTIVLGGSSPGQFTMSETCPASLAVNTTCAITVRFKPTSAGAKAASVTVTTGGGAAAKTVSLSGTGT